MIQRNEGFSFPGLETQTYKDEPGTWMAVTRRTLAPGSATEFETRYFEIAPGGYTSYEQHAHEHVVVVLRGQGRVRLGGEWSEIGPGDTVHVGGMAHQFDNPNAQPFGHTVCRRPRAGPSRFSTRRGVLGRRNRL